MLSFEDNSTIYVDTVPLKANDAWIHVDTSWGYTEINGNYYLKEGGRIRIGVTFNKDVYDDGKSGNEFMTAGNTENYINIEFRKQKDGQTQTETRRAIITGNNSDLGKKYCVYEYIVEKNDSFFDGTAYVSRFIQIAPNIVWDNAGNTNASQNSVTLRRQGDLWKDTYDSDTNKIYVDVMKPQVTHTWIDVRDTYGYKEANGNYYLKEGGKIRVGVTFDEWVYDKGKSRKCLYDSR